MIMKTLNPTLGALIPMKLEQFLKIFQLFYYLKEDYWCRWYFQHLMFLSLHVSKLTIAQYVAESCRDECMGKPVVQIGWKCGGSQTVVFSDDKDFKAFINEFEKSKKSKSVDDQKYFSVDVENGDRIIFTPSDIAGFSVSGMVGESSTRPDYYCGSDGKDLFDRFEAGMMSRNEVIGFYKGNIIKYVVRHEGKNGIEDLSKARTYVERLIKFEKGDVK